MSSEVVHAYSCMLTTICPTKECVRVHVCRLEEHKLPASLSLPLQLDFAALCNELGACGDFDRLACASLAISTAEMQEMGLSEMTVSLMLWLCLAAALLG